MPTFISTIRFTSQGIKAVHETTQRSAAIKSLAKKMGIKVKDIYWTMGDDDVLLIIDAPDDETAAALLLKVGALGNVQTSTARAFNTAEMNQVLEKMGGA